jgi:dynein heavy chain
MKKFSAAAANLCAWVVNIVAYNAIYKNVAPKIAAKKNAEDEYEVASQKLRAVEEKVAMMQQKLKSVTDKLKFAMDESNAAEERKKACEDRLALAKRLVDGLADENTRWGASVEGFNERGRTLVGDVMLASSFVSYIGAFNQAFRLKLWKETWIPDLDTRKIPLTEGVDPLCLLANESDFAKWKNEGLAADRISLENGALITQCSRWPVMIDPQLQGITWIRNRVQNLKVIQLSQKKWLQTLTKAISNGDGCLIEGVGEELDATLNPILARSTVQRGGITIMKVGNEEVQYDNNFRLFLQTKLSSPHYQPEIAAQTTLINFIVTEEGLQEQLLALVVNKERPELEEKRTTLVRAINDYMVSLTDLENELLERLSNAPDDILSDVALIKGLEDTKLAATEIEHKVELAKKQNESINTTRNEYSDVAAEGSWLYFLLIQLHALNHMYQYSLAAFKGFFMKAMSLAEKAEVTAERVALLRESIRITVFTWVNRGLFETQKLIFRTQLCFKLMVKGALKYEHRPAELDYLIRGPVKTGVDKPPAMDWLPENAWMAVQALVKLEGFEKFATDMEASPNRFKEWYSKTRPEAAPLPLVWRKLDNEDPFKKLLIMRAMRMDRMTTAMNDFVEKALPHGKSFTESDQGLSFLEVLRRSLEDSTTVNPIFFILSPGTDPVATLEVIAKKRGFYPDKYQKVALGEGQDKIAMRNLEKGHKEGHWIVLENIHLMPKWTRELEKQLDVYAVEGSHPDFRLFLSAEAVENSPLPVGLLERSVKLTNEPPQGLKQNIKRAFATFDKDDFELYDPKVKTILFGLCHFHSIVIERIKFGPKGWNVPYPFNTGDLLNSSTVLNNYLETVTDKIPWKDLRYIFGDILYGGHITDDKDRDLCRTYLDFYMKEELLDEMELFPFNELHPEDTFPAPGALAYEAYNPHVDKYLSGNSPIAFGLHPNAEIAVKTRDGDQLFRYVMELQPRTAASGEAAGANNIVVAFIEGINERVKSISFNLEDLRTAVADAEDTRPYTNVFLQECERMNMLCDEIRRSLKELDLGLSGELQMSDKMEQLQDALFLSRVPTTWEKLAYPSTRGLGPWLDDLSGRANQLITWTEEPTVVPVVVHISYLFNPYSFLTAIKQRTAQSQKLELDKLVIHTDVTRKTAEEVDSRARDGAYISGLFMDGANWNWNASVMEESEPRKNFCSMPVINCRAIMSEKQEKSGVYRCPVYKTPIRGPTYVFDASLRSKLPAAKWVLAGVCLTLEKDKE